MTRRVTLILGLLTLDRFAIGHTGSVGGLCQ
jgi:hypothetical protein